MFKVTNVIDFVSIHSPKINQKNLEYGLLVFLTFFVYFYINLSIINFWFVYIITKTFTKSGRYEKPVQSVLEEISNFLNILYNEYMKYKQKYTIPSSSKENPIDLTNDSDSDSDSDSDNDSDNKIKNSDN